MYDASTPAAAFLGDRLLASGPMAEVARAVAGVAEPGRALILLDDGRPIDLDLRGTPDEVVARLPAAPQDAPRGRGRPKLGVTAREVTLLPRHWDWLARQPGGASVALRKLVEAAQRDPREEARAAREATYRAMTVLAGNRPNYEEATRALFAGDGDTVRRLVADWPVDIRDYLLTLARLP